MSKDFRAKQVRTNKIIGRSEGALGDGVAGSKIQLALMKSGSADFAGGITGPTGTDSGNDVGRLKQINDIADANNNPSIGTDVWMVVDGNSSKKYERSSGESVLFLGDVVVSGTLYTERQRINISTYSITANSEDRAFITSGSIFVNERQGLSIGKTLVFPKEGSPPAGGNTLTDPRNGLTSADSVFWAGNNDGSNADDATSDPTPLLVIRPDDAVASGGDELGRVGIGTKTPAAKLEIFGPVGGGGSSTATHQFKITHSNDVESEGTPAADDYFAILVNDSGSTTLSTNDGSSSGADTSGHLKLDADGGIELNATTGNFEFKDDAQMVLQIQHANVGDAVFKDGGGQEIFRLDNSANSLLMSTDKKIEFHDAGIFAHANADGQFTLSSDGNSADAINIVASDAAGGIDIDAGTGGIAIDSTGQIHINSTLDGANAIKLLTNSGTSESIVIQNAQGTGATAIAIAASKGGINVTAETNINFDADGGIISFKDSGVIIAEFDTSTLSSNNLKIFAKGSTTQRMITLVGANGATTVMTEDGDGDAGTNNAHYTLTIGGNIELNSATGAFTFKDDAQQVLKIEHDTGNAGDAVFKDGGGQEIFRLDNDANSLLMETNKKIEFRDAALSIHSSADGQLDINADTELQITAPTVDIDASTVVNISNDLVVGGDLTVSGGVTQLDVERVAVEDPLIELAKGQDNTTDALDIGFFGKYGVGGTHKYAGLFRDANDSGKFHLFKDATENLTNATTINRVHSDYAKADLVVNSVDVDDAGGITATTTINLTAPNIELGGDGAVLKFGADDDVTLTHVHNDGLRLTSGKQIQFGDSSLNIRGNGTDLFINSGERIIETVGDEPGHIIQSTTSYPQLSLQRLDGEIIGGEILGLLSFGGSEDSGSTRTISAQILAKSAEAWNAGADPDECAASLHFATRPTSDNLLHERLTILSDGKVGIGVSDPDAQLEVLSTGTQQKWSNDGNSFAKIDVLNASHAAISTGESGNFEIDAAGTIELDAGGGLIYFNSGGAATPQNPQGANSYLTAQMASEHFEFMGWTNTTGTRILSFLNSQYGTAAVPSIRVDTDKKLTFRDAHAFINSSASKTLNIQAGEEGSNDGTINIGTTDTSTITIGESGVTTTTIHGLDLGGSVSLNSDTASLTFAGAGTDPVLSRDGSANFSISSAGGTMTFTDSGGSHTLSSLASGAVAAGTVFTTQGGDPADASANHRNVTSSTRRIAIIGSGSVGGVHADEVYGFNGLSSPSDIVFFTSGSIKPVDSAYGAFNGFTPHGAGTEQERRNAAFDCNLISSGSVFLRGLYATNGAGDIVAGSGQGSFPHPLHGAGTGYVLSIDQANARGDNTAGALFGRAVLHGHLQFSYTSPDVRIPSNGLSFTAGDGTSEVMLVKPVDAGGHPAVIIPADKKLGFADASTSFITSDGGSPNNVSVVAHGSLSLSGGSGVAMSSGWTANGQTCANLGTVSAATSITSTAFVGPLTGNADTATALAAGRTFKVDLTSTSASSAFTGGSNISDIGVNGTLPAANGGTGLTSIATLLNSNVTPASLSLEIGADVQAHDAQLDDIAGLTPTDGGFIVGNGSAFVLETGSTARTSLGVGTGDEPQFTAIKTNTIKSTSSGNNTYLQFVAATGDYNNYFKMVQAQTPGGATPSGTPVIEIGAHGSSNATNVDVRIEAKGDGVLRAYSGGSNRVIVTDTETQTLSNKTINLSNNALAGTFAQFNTACSDRTLVSTIGVETLTNKTLTQPIIQQIAYDADSIHSVPNVANDTFAVLSATQILSNKTLAAPKMTGNVGIGTTSPSHALHVSSDAANGAEIVVTQHINDQDPPNFRAMFARGTEASKAIVQNNDILGNLAFHGYDGSDFDCVAAEIRCDVDGAPGSDDMPGRLHFRTAPDGSDAPTTRMTILNDGKVGIGEETPDEALHVKDTSTTNGFGNSILRLEDFRTDGFSDGDGPGIKFAGGDADSPNNVIGRYAVVRDGADNKGRALISVGTNGNVHVLSLRETHIEPHKNILPLTDNSLDLGSPSKRFANLYTGDLHLNNMGSSNDVDGTSGNWTIQEGKDNLYVINNLTGKKFKMALTPVEEGE